MSLIDIITKAVGRSGPSNGNRRQHEDAKRAGEKREMERRLHAGGMSIREAKKAVAAFYGQDKG
jgi:hypothetical protein